MPCKKLLFTAHNNQCACPLCSPASLGAGLTSQIPKLGPKSENLCPPDFQCGWISKIYECLYTYPLLVCRPRKAVQVRWLSTLSGSADPKSLCWAWIWKCESNDKRSKTKKIVRLKNLSPDNTKRKNVRDFFIKIDTSTQR